MSNTSSLEPKMLNLQEYSVTEYDAIALMRDIDVVKGVKSYSYKLEVAHGWYVKLEFVNHETTKCTKCSLILSTCHFSGNSNGVDKVKYATLSLPVALDTFIDKIHGAIVTAATRAGALAGNDFTAVVVGLLFKKWFRENRNRSE